MAGVSWSLAGPLVSARKYLRRPAGISRTSSARFSPVSRLVKPAWLEYSGRRKGLWSLCERVVGGWPGDPEPLVMAWLVWRSEA